MGDCNDIDNVYEYEDTITDITKELQSFKEMITNVAIIKKDMREIKPKIGEVRDSVVKLEVWRKTAHSRIRRIESSIERLRSSYQCTKSSDITALEVDSKKNNSIVSTLERSVSVNENSIIDMKKSTSKFIYWIVGILIAVGSSILTWYASWNTLKANFDNLNSNYQKLDSTVEQLQINNNNQSKELQRAIHRLRIDLVD